MSDYGRMTRWGLTMVRMVWVGCEEDLAWYWWFGSFGGSMDAILMLSYLGLFGQFAHLEKPSINLRPPVQRSLLDYLVFCQRFLKKYELPKNLIIFPPKNYKAYFKRTKFEKVLSVKLLGISRKFFWQTFQFSKKTSFEKCENFARAEGLFIEACLAVNTFALSAGFASAI